MDTLLAIDVQIISFTLLLVIQKEHVSCIDVTIQDPVNSTVGMKQRCTCEFKTPTFPSTQVHWKITPLDLSSSLVFTHDFTASSTSTNSYCNGKCTGSTISRSNTAGEVELQISPLNGFFHGQIECQVDLAVGSLSSGNVGFNTFSDITKVQANFQYEGQEAIGRVTGCMPSCTMLFSNEIMVNQTCSNEVITRDPDDGTYSQSCASPVSGDSLQLIVEIRTIDGTEYKTLLLEVTTTTTQDTTTSLGPTTSIQTTQEHESTFVSESTTYIMTESQTEFDESVTDEISTTETPSGDSPSENKNYLFFLFLLIIIPVLAVVGYFVKYQYTAPIKKAHRNGKNRAISANGKRNKPNEYHREPKQTHQYDYPRNAYIVQPFQSKTHIQGDQNKHYPRTNGYQKSGNTDNYPWDINNWYAGQTNGGYQRKWTNYTRDPYNEYRSNWYPNYTSNHHSDHQMTTNHARAPNNGGNYNFPWTSNYGFGNKYYYSHPFYQK